jgi:hypothetical protein
MYKRSPLLNIESIVVQVGALEALENIRDESLASIRNTDDAKAVNEMIAVLKSSIQTDAVAPHHQSLSDCRLPRWYHASLFICPS